MSNIANMAEIRPYGAPHAVPYQALHAAQHAPSYAAPQHAGPYAAPQHTGPYAASHLAQHTGPYTASHLALHAPPYAAPHTPHVPPYAAPHAALDLKHLCVSEASELTGNAQTTRDELFSLFGKFVHYSDANLPKDLAEAQDKLLRKEAREKFQHELHISGATVVHNQTHVVVSWKGKTVTRKVAEDKRNAARSAFVTILREKATEWPIPPRPNRKMMHTSALAIPTNLEGVSSCIQPTKLSLLVGGHKKRQDFATNIQAQVNQASSGSIERPVMIPDFNAYKQYVKQIANIDIKKLALDRLYILYQLIHGPNAPVKDMTQDSDNNCMLGFKSLHVKQPEFYQRILELVNDEIWYVRSISTKPLKKPTWVVYELLREIGVHPMKHCRGPKQYDPGPKEFLYSEIWMFDKQIYLKNRYRLQVNYIDRGCEAEKEVTRSDLEVLRTELEAMRNELGQYKKAAEAKEKAEVVAEVAAQVAAQVAVEIAAQAIAEIAAEAIAEAIEKAEVAAEVATEAVAKAIAELITEVAAEARTEAAAEARAELEAMRTKLEEMRTELEQYKKAEKEKAQPSVNSQTTTVVSMVLDETEAAASLLELMRDPQISKKRNRDPSTRSGGSAQKKIRVNDNDQDLYAVMEPVMERLNIAKEKKEINVNAYKRLVMIQRLLYQWQNDDLVTMKTIVTQESMESRDIDTNATNCILGWAKLLVKDPLKLNEKIHKMIEEDEGGIWKKANGKYKQPLKNPTYVMYELFRKIGVKPGFRGPNEGDPGKHDLFYYTEWEFKDDESFKKAYKRLAKGFCPRKRQASLQEEG